MDQAAALFFGYPFWSWIAIGGIFLIGELISGSGWLLWPAGAAGTTGFVSLTGIGWPWQFVLFIVIAVAATYVGRRFLRPAGHGPVNDINDPAPRLLGQQGETVSPFKSGLGRVFVDGKEWAAELDGGGDLGAKSKVEVVEILGGARLRVRAA